MFYSAFSGGDCLIPPGQFNPLGLLIRPGGQEISLNSIHSHSSAFKHFATSKSTTNVHQNRFRRDQSYVVGSETYVYDNGNNSKVVKMVCD